MESMETAEKIRAAVEEEQREVEAERADMADERARHQAIERFRSRTALVISALAALLAIVAMRGDETSVEIVHANIQVNDLWAFYQARNIRKTDTEIAIKQIARDMAEREATLPPQAAVMFQVQRAEFEQQIRDFESKYDPAYPGDKMRGTGMAELMYQARHWEHERDVLQQKLPNYHYSEALLQIAIVLASSSIVLNSRRALGAALVVGVVGLLLAVNGTMLLVPLTGAGAYQ